MRFTMIAIGSMGDVRPYILLGEELNKRGHHITIAAFEPFREAVINAGLDFAPLSGDVTKFMATVMSPGTNGLNYLPRLETCLRDIASTLPNDLMASCQNAEAIICTYFGSMIYSIAEKKQIPCVQTHYYPMDYNASFPISSAPNIKLGKVWNKTTYKVGYLMISALERRYLKEWRRNQGVSIRKIKSAPDYSICGHVVPVIYAMSPLIMPRPISWGAHIRMTGYWLNEESTDYVPPPELMAFLAKKPKPVYIGFGSMVSGDMGNTLETVIKAVKEAGVRAVMLKGWSGQEIPESDHIYAADYIPHDWLFEYVTAVVHHGGAGTTAAGLRAGCPTLVVSFGGDQPFWGSRVRALGCGPKPIKRENLTVPKLTAALNDLTQNETYKIAAQELGIRLKSEKGIHNAADTIEEEIHKWLKTPPQP